MLLTDAPLGPRGTRGALGALPRLPVFGWASLGGARSAGIPSLLDRQQIVLTSSGSAAILLALEALGTVAGESVLVPTYHCPTMISPVHTLGARPLFYPLTASGAADLEWLSRQELHDVKAMLAVHFFGLLQPMESIAAWCRERRIALIEDCAHALFGQAGNRPVGAWGVYAIGSLKKFLPVAEGGCLVANEGAALPRLKARAPMAGLKAALRAIELGAQYGRLQGANWTVHCGVRLLGRVRSTPVARAHSNDDERIEPGVLSKLDATLSHSRATQPSGWLARWLPRARIVERRRRHYARLATRLTGSPAIYPLMPALPEHCAPHVFPLWVRQPDPGYLALRRLGVPVYRWDFTWPDTPRIAGDSGAAWSHHVLQIGCHQDLTDGDVGRIADVLLQVFGADPLHAADEA